MSTMQSVLVLNQNYEPINICNTRRALKLIFKNKAEAVENTPRMVHAANQKFAVPSVIRLYQFIRRPHLRISYNRKNVIRRDAFTCQYCGEKPGVAELTVDHILPRSKGGPDSWTNVVAACKKCNNQKADRTPRQAEMDLLSRPKDPNPFPALLLSWRISVEQHNWQSYFYAD